MNVSINHTLTWLTVPVQTTAVAVREQMVGKTVQQDGVLVHAAIAAAAVVDARGVHVGALHGNSIDFLHFGRFFVASVATYGRLYELAVQEFKQSGMRVEMARAI